MMKACLVLLSTLLLVLGCDPAWGPKISVHWSKPQPNVTVDTPLRYQSLEIGRVSKVDPEMSGTTVQIRVRKKYSHHVRENSTFLVRPGRDGDDAFIELRPLKMDAPPAKDGAVFQGSVSDLDATARGLVTDWKRTTVLFAAAAAAVLLLVFLLKLFLTLWAWLLCLVAGTGAAYYLSGFVEMHVSRVLPPTVRTDLVAYVVAFLIGFIVANIVVSVLFRPLRSRR